jgi:hypothetical protein
MAIRKCFDHHDALQGLAKQVAYWGFRFGMLGVYDCAGSAVVKKK